MRWSAAGDNIGVGGPMKPPMTVLFFLFSVLLALFANDLPAQIALTVPSGAPLRVYLTSKVRKKVDAPVRAKMIEPVFAFDREVIPAGADVVGRVVRVHPVPRRQRAQAMVNGDFTPLHRAEI